MDIKIYDPAQPFVPFDQMEPSFSGTYGANGQLNFEPDLTEILSIAPWNLAQAADIKTLAVANFTFAPPKGSFFGPHAIVVQANFVINDGLGNSMAQSVRQLAVIDVLPDGGQSGTAIYWTILECWLPDW